MFDQKSFESQIPSSFRPVLEVLLSYGFIPTLVGGSVRDFFLIGKTGKDWDIELGHETIAFNKNEWKEVGKSLSKFGKITFLPYEIIRLEIETYEFEFSPPRIEHYKENAKDHSNFDAEFNFKLPFELAIRRRDFSINAMGIRFLNKKNMSFLDPLEGLRHLREKILYPAGADFYKDPVRYLRAIRFSLKYHFEFSTELKMILRDMNVDSFTPAYLWSEMQKSKDPVTFLKILQKEKLIHPHLKLPVDKDIEAVRKIIADPSKHESWIIALEWLNIPWEQWRSYFNLSSETSRRLSRWAQVAREFETIMPETFHGEFEAVRQSENFAKVFDWYFTTKQLLQKYPELPLMKMIQDYLPAWVHLYKFDILKDVKHIDPPFRAKYQVWNLCQRI